MKHQRSIFTSRAPGARLFAAVCIGATLAAGLIACSGRKAQSAAPLAAPVSSAGPASPSTGADPSLPSASEVLAGRAFEPVEPAPTF